FPPGPGGLGTHAWQLARHLHKSGWEITVAASQDYATADEINDFNRAQPFPIISIASNRFPPLRFLKRWRTVSAWLNQNKPDAIIASGSRSVWMAAALFNRYRLPWIAVGHGSELSFRTPTRKRITRWAFQKANGVICVSEFTRQQMNKSGICVDKTCVIPNGADPDLFQILPAKEVESFRAGLGFTDAKLILTVGNVTERKGQDVVIRALPEVIEEIPNVHYMIVGLPTKKKELEELARQIGVSEHVKFFERVNNEELVRFFNSCDVFVMTSKMTSEGDFEGYGIAVVESALCGKPSVVSGNSGLSEAVIDGETAFVVPENDERATAKAIIQILKDEEFRQQMGEKARHYAITQQTWAKRIAHYDQFLREILQSSNRSRLVSV
ncbi:glycosyltransferase family 4 protein, partial [bacterium]|nr:glycosyltransferase family 4 protein [bacterium]